MAFNLSCEFVTSDHLIEEPFDFVAGGLLSKTTNMSGTLAIGLMK